MRPKPYRRPPSLGLALRRHPRARLALVLVAALVVGWSVLLSSRAADDRQRAWGTSIDVLVATVDIPAGAPIDATNTSLVAHPAALVPDGAHTSLPQDLRAAAPIWAGETVRAERVAPAGLSVVAARLPDGMRAVAIPVEPGTTPPLSVGDRVDVLVALAPEAAGGGPPGFALTTGVLVVEVTDTAVTVAVSPDAAPRVAVALGQGAVTLALVGAP